MVSPIKITLRLALLGGGAYWVYKNKDRIIGKINKLARMGSVEEMTDDVALTASNMLSGASTVVEDAYEYVSTLGDDGVVKENIALKNEIEAQVEGLPLNYATSLKSSADNLVSDIKNWADRNYNYQGKYTQIGKMPEESFIKWHNYLNTSKSEDFKRITNMVNIMLQYEGYPTNIKSDAKRNLSLPKIEYYIANPPKRFTELNDIDWGERAKINYRLKPKDLFRVIRDRLSNEGML